MKTLKLLALVAVLGLASLASAQTLTRSLVLKPSGSTGTATLTSGAIGVLGDSYTLTLPAGGRAQTGPILKQTNTTAGDKPMIFGQIDLTSNTPTTGDITGTLGVANGGTGLSNAPINSILYASAANTYSSLSPASTDGQVLGNVSGVPTWGTTLGGSGATTNISNTGAGNTTNINAGGTGGTTNIGNATSTTIINGTIQLPLATDNIWVGVANVATATPPGTAGQVLTIVGTTPTWSSSFGNAGSATTIVGGPLNLNSTGGATNIATSGTGTTTIGNNAGPSVTNLAGDVNFTATTPVNFSVMPELPLPQNNMYVGNSSGYAQAFPTTASSVMTSSALGAPQWSSSLGVSNGGTGLTSLAAGSLTYGSGGNTMSTLPIGTSGFVLSSTGTAPSWVSVGSLITNIAGQYTILAADETAGFAVITPAAATGYTAASKVVITIEATTSGFAQAAVITSKTGTTFTVSLGAITAGDKINYIIIN